MGSVKLRKDLMNIKSIVHNCYDILINPTCKIFLIIAIVKNAECWDHRFLGGWNHRVNNWRYLEIDLLLGSCLLAGLLQMHIHYYCCHQNILNICQKNNQSIYKPLKNQGREQNQVLNF
jgi:hypothetical protein